MKQATKKDIAEDVAIKCGFSILEASNLVDDMLEIVANSIKADKSLKIHNFGRFEVKQKNERIGRNPKTGEEVKIPPQKSLSFYASQNFIKEVNL